MATGDLFGIGVSGLLVAQRGLSTTGHNIANVNTEGYTRQRAEVVTRPAQAFGSGFIGTGAQVSTVRRVFDGFLVDQVRTNTTSAGYLERFHDFSSQLDTLLPDPNGNLTPALQGFFSALHDLADDPASIPARQVVLGEAQTLVNRFQLLDQRLRDARSAVNQELGAVVGEVNSITERIGELNRQIVVAEGSAGGQPANDLRDQRDELVRQLAERVDIIAFEQDGAGINITTGAGQALVVGSTVASLSVLGNPYDATRSEVGYTVAGVTSLISDAIRGGELGGVLAFREQVLDPAQNALGRIALGVASEVNAQHRLGADLNGQLGRDFFTPIGQLDPEVRPASDNTGAPPADITVSLSDVGALSTSDYRLDRTGGLYSLTRLSDNTSFNLSVFPGGPETVDGMTFALGAGNIADGDSFLIQPTRSAARGLGLALTDPAGVAAAAPIRTAAALGNTGGASVSIGAVNSPDNLVSINFTTATTFDVVDNTTGAALASGVSYAAGAPIRFNGWTVNVTGVPAAGDTFAVDHTITGAGAGNTGTGVVSTASVSAPDPNLTDPVTITFDDPPTTFTVGGATTGSPSAGVAYSSGSPVSFNGWTISISGVPAAGDVFTVEPNTNGVGDNRNALSIAALQTADTLENHGASFGDAYGQLVAEVGTVTQRAETSRVAQEVLLRQAVDARDAVSGVNLDEEAANLLRLQQAYQANARVLAVADEIFDFLIGAVGG